MAAAVVESSPPERRTTAFIARRRSSHASCLRIPDVLVLLELQAYRQMILEQPLRQIRWREHAVHWREEDGFGLRREVVFAHDRARVLVVGAIFDDELHLVVRAEGLEIRPMHLRGFP